jgi:hypothetical protein
MKKTILLSIMLLIFFCGFSLQDNFAFAKAKKCSDSDGGMNYYKSGKTKGQAMGTQGVNYVIKKNGKPDFEKMDGSYSLFYDHCANKVQLNEGYCYKNKLTSIGYSCPKGCKKGACIK